MPCESDFSQRLLTLLFYFRKIDAERGARFAIGFDTDLPAHALDTAPRDRQTDAKSRISLCRRQALKDMKDALAVGHIDADAVVANAQSQHRPVVLREDGHLRRGSRLDECHRV